MVDRKLLMIDWFVYYIQKEKSKKSEWVREKKKTGERNKKNPKGEIKAFGQQNFLNWSGTAIFAF